MTPPVVPLAELEGWVGKRALIGITYVRPGGEAIEQRQWHGVVEAVRPGNVGIRRADTGELEWVPADREAFGPGLDAEYRLRSTGEVVASPDLVAAFVYEPPER